MSDEEHKKAVTEAVTKAKEEAEQNVMRKLEGQNKIIKPGCVSVEQKRLEELEEKEKDLQKKGLSDNENVRALKEETKKDKERHSIEIAKLNEKIKQQSISSVVRSALADLNPIKDEDIIKITGSKLDMRDGKIVVLDDMGEVEYDGGNPLSVESFYKNFANDNPHYFKTTETTEKGTGQSKRMDTTQKPASNILHKEGSFMKLMEEGLKKIS